MRRWLHAQAERRARAIASRVNGHLPPGRALDIGSRTGHNAEALRGRGDLDLFETDVADLHVVGPGPVVFGGGRLPFADRAFRSSLLVYVLHYPDDPAALLREAARVGRRVIVIQSTYAGVAGRVCLWLRELLTGRLAFRIARWTGFVRAVRCPLEPRRYFTRGELRAAVRDAGLVEKRHEASGWTWPAVSRDLYVLEPRGAHP